VAPESAEGLLTAVSASGEVVVQGLLAGQLEGFVFVPDRAVRDGSRGLLAAANRALRSGIRERVGAFEQATDTAFDLLATGQITWEGVVVARIARADSPLAPTVEPFPTDLLDAPLRERVRRRLAAFVAAHLRARLMPLFALREKAPGGATRGLAFVVSEGLGSVPRSKVDDLVREMADTERRAVAALGLTLGRASVFLPALLLPDLIRLRATLYRAACGSGLPRDAPEPDGRSFLAADSRLPMAFYEACGYQVAGPLAVRVDRLHRLAGVAAHKAHAGAFPATPDLAGAAGLDLAGLPAVLESLGDQTTAEGLFIRSVRSRRPRPALR